MTYSDNCARNHKLTYTKLRAGMHAFTKVVNANNESVINGLLPTLFFGATPGGTVTLGALYYVDTAGLYQLAQDLGPTNNSKRVGLGYCVGATGAGSVWDGVFMIQGTIRTLGNHGKTPGVYGYLSKTTPGLIVANEGATANFSDAHTPAKPIIVGTYLPANLFSFHVPLVYE